LSAAIAATAAVSIAAIPSIKNWKMHISMIFQNNIKSWTYTECE